MNGILIEAATEARGGRWRIRIIRAGLSGNRNFYPDAALREAAPLFEGARVFVKGDAEHQRGGGKDFRNLIGRLVNVAFVEGQSPNNGELDADLELIDAQGDIARKLREAWDRGMTELFGFSIDARGAATPKRIAGQNVRFVERMTAVDSVDLIVEPGAGGQVIKLIESKESGKMPKVLTPDQAKLALVESKLPKAAQERIVADFGDAAEIGEDELREAIKRERDYIARFTESGNVRGLGDFSRIEAGEGRPQKVAKMLDAFFDPKDSSVTSIRECYVDITGDRRITGMRRNCDEARMRESLASGDWADVLGDAVQRRLVAMYRTPNLYDVWRQIVTIVPVGDFRTQHRGRVGGYGDLPMVNEGNPYESLTSPDDEEATYAIAKRGGTEDITLEMIANDDVGAVRRVPDKLNRAAKRTLSKFVLDLLKDNPDIYDGVALFHADHNNLGTAALDATSLAAARLAMKRQTELSSSDPIGVGPRFLIVPDDLEQASVDLFNRNTNNDKTFIESLSLIVLPVWYWTDATDWCAVADPMDVPSIEIGFFNGQEEPELFIQDLPTQGSMFSHDKLTYKIRHIYGGNIVDYRGLYKGIVA